MADDIQKLYDATPDFNPDTAEHETEPQEAIKPGIIDELDGNFEKITINKEGIYVGDTLDPIHIFVNKSDLDNLKTTLLNEIANHPSKDEVYSTAKMDVLLREKADASDVYEKTETFNQSEINTKLATKADIENTYDKVDSDRAYLKIKDLPLSINPSIGYANLTDQEIAFKSPFNEDSFVFTQAEYDSLSDESKRNNKLFFITDETSEDLLSSVKPILATNQVKAVRSGETLELTFTLRTSVTLVGEIDGDNNGTLTIDTTQKNKAIYKAPQVQENTTVLLKFRGVRNNLESQTLEIPITVIGLPDTFKVITFDGNGAAYGENEPESIAQNEDKKWVFILPDVGNFKPQYNMELKGWSTSSSDENQFLGIPGDTITFENNNPVTLYAIWQNVNSRQVSIVFEPNGGTGTMEKITTHIGEYETPECKFKAPAGRTFLYWSQNSIGSSGQVQQGKTINIRYPGVYTLFAIWGDANSDILVKPDKPIFSSDNVAFVYEGETNNLTYIADYLLKLHVDSDFAGNEVQINGNIISVKGVVPLSTMNLLVYQTSGYGIDSNLTQTTINVREKNPDTLILKTGQSLTTQTQTSLVIEFENFDTRCILELKDYTGTEVVVENSDENKGKVFVNPTSTGIKTFKVVQKREGVQGANLESLPLEISVEVS